jgi:predicted nucleic acid-binding Zn ribbon protein
LNKKNSETKLIHISGILNSVLGKYRPAKDTQMTKIWDIWDDTIGKPIAMNAKPDSFKNGILNVNVSSSSWIHQLKFLEKEMILNINKELGQKAVKKLRFKIGNILS